MVWYWAQILQDSSTYIDEILWKVWSVNSSWFPGYSFLCTLAIGVPYGPGQCEGGSDGKMVVVFPQDCVVILSSNFAGFKHYYSWHIVQSLKSKLVMVPRILPPKYFGGTGKLPCRRCGRSHKKIISQCYDVILSSNFAGFKHLYSWNIVQSLKSTLIMVARIPPPMYFRHRGPVWARPLWGGCDGKTVIEFSQDCGVILSSNFVGFKWLYSWNIV